MTAFVIHLRVEDKLEGRNDAGLDRKKEEEENYQEEGRKEEEEIETQESKEMEIRDKQGKMRDLTEFCVCGENACRGRRKKLLC